MHRVGLVAASLGAMAFGTACLDDRPVGPRDAVVRLGLHASIEAGAFADRTIGIQASYRKSSGEQISLTVDPPTVVVPGGTTTTRSVNLNIGPCLDDLLRLDARERGCRFTLVVSLRNTAGQQLSVTSRDLDSRDFEGTAAAPLSVALRAPTLVISPSAVEFTATAGQTNLPTEQAATIAPDVSTAPVGTLSATIAYSGTATNWLRATLDPATRRLTLTPTTASLAAPQTYTATVAISSSVEGVQPASLTVTYRMALPRHALTVGGSGTGTGLITSSPAGIDCTITASARTGTCQASFDQGTDVTLTATAATGSVFSGWTGACTASATTCVVRMAQPSAVTAVFDPPISLIKVSGDGATLTVGDTVSLVARVMGPGGKPVSGVVVRFLGAGVDASVTSNALGNASVLFFGRQPGTALIDATVQPGGPSVRFTITVTTLQTLVVQSSGQGTGSGTVGSNPGPISCTFTSSSVSGTCSANYPLGTVVTLTISVQSGSTFGGWTGGCVASGFTCRVVMDQPKIVFVTIR